MKAYFLLLLFSLSSVVFAREVRYPNLDGIGQQSIGLAMLKLAIEKSGADMTAVVDSNEVNQNRVRQQVENGQLDIFDTGFDETLDGRFKPIYLPIDLGLTGWRLFIIHQDTQEKIENVKDISQLSQFVMGQGQGWGDIRILEAAGLQVTTAPRIEILIKMVGGKRFDLFPLGATEVHQFLETYRGNQKQLMVENQLVLIYPYGRFFYIRNNDKELEDMLAKGLEAAFNDGSLRDLLFNHPFSSDAFTKANLAERTHILIPSPTLTEGFKAIDDKWWYVP
ncbi:hypothetical protein [Vibrio pectenicida]|uniref:Transporter substrate-binding domain-containing protein n=1 Tax=Vibrio pectenicida TaxID=62763 RepID=A0A427TVX3_9VIBR|nr:hypothetical protein [Vibrio pectenicida]RSD28552.1 hypothetical protein EJA03_19100 [Vibrio pectenicida]